MIQIKNILIAIALFAVTGVAAQEAVEKAVFEKDGELIRATYFHAEGVVSQKGTFKDGKLHGSWVSYDEAGNRTAMGQYTSGVKSGKWFFWNNGQLAEVDYSENRVANVHTWKNPRLVAK